MSDQSRTTLEVRSEVRQDGTLRLSLESMPLPAPGPDEIVVEIAAAPLHPADIGLLFGPADLSNPTISDNGEDESGTFPIPASRMASLFTRMGKLLPVGNEGAGTVVDAGAAHRDMIGKPVAVMGGGMVTRYRVVSAMNFLPIPELMPYNAEAMQKAFASPKVAEATATRNGTLQGAYLIIAARALRPDCGPMSGFDNADVDQAFFAGARIRSNFICSIGHGNPDSLFPRNPRLSFEEAGYFA